MFYLTLFMAKTQRKCTYCKYTYSDNKVDPIKISSTNNCSFFTS